MAAETGEFWKSFFPEKNNEKDNSQFVAELQPLPQSTTASTIICQVREVVREQNKKEDGCNLCGYFISSSTLSFLIVLGIIVLFIIMFYHLHVNFVKLNSSLDRIENSVDRLAANKNKRLQK
uniref:Uncharacterized protein n=1 Tax=Meloidogyne enterolobii TaxID=390850 RepID=A0A6V7UJJ7_MELEN|nr:unnamed protein product [Meloidogyne enterolobii]